MTIAEELNRVLKYNTDTINELLHQLNSAEQRQHRWGQDDPLNGLRGVLADALDEQDRSKEATLLRTPNQHVMVSEGRIRPAKFTNKPTTLAFNKADVVGEKRHPNSWRTLSMEWSLVDPKKGLVEQTEYENTPPYDEANRTTHHIVDLRSHLADRLSSLAGDKPHKDVQQAIEAVRNAPYEEVDLGHSSERDNGFGFDDPNAGKY